MKHFIVNIYFNVRYIVLLNLHWYTQKAFFSTIVIKNINSNVFNSKFPLGTVSLLDLTGHSQPYLA